MKFLERLIPRRQFVKLASWVAATLAIGKKPGTAWIGHQTGVRIGSVKARTDQVVDVIVIGAGIFGCSVAWHLRRRGVKVLVIEEASTPATRTTQGAAGFVASWSGFHVPAWGKPEWQMQRYGIDFYTQLAESCGRDFGFSQCGVAYIGFHPEVAKAASTSSKSDPGRKSEELLPTWQTIQTRIEAARELGTNIEVLTKQRAAKLLPLIDSDSTEWIIFDPDAVGVRAGEATRCVAKELVQQGVRFEYNTSVTGFIRDGKRVVGVTTSAGNYHAPTVIVTAGVWSSPLLEKAGASCPARSRPDTRYTTKPLPGIPPNTPLLMFFNPNHVYIREERGGLLIGGHGPATGRAASLDPAHRVREYIRQFEHVMPVLKYAEIDQITPCLASFTSDSHFIADAVPGYPGMYVITGCQEAGITHGPGLGRMMAELVVEGKTTWNRSPFRLDRFGAEDI